MAKYGDEHIYVCVCVCVCVCVFARISPKPHTWSLVLLWWGDSIPRGMDNFWGVLPHWECIVQHSIWDLYKNGWTDWDAILHEGLVGPKEPYIRWWCRSPKGRGNICIFGLYRRYTNRIIIIIIIQKHWQSSLQRTLRPLQCRCKRDHSVVNNVMQQSGSLSMTGKCK